MSELTQKQKLEFQTYDQEKLNEALIDACKEGNLHIIKYLLTSLELKEHADIHAQNDWGFICACENGHLDVVRYLLTSPELKDHADIHAKNDRGFQWAFNNEHWEVVQYLLTFSGENYISFQEIGYTLNLAMENCYHDIVKAMTFSLYKNDRFAYIENLSKIEQYCLDNSLNFEEWKEEMVKNDVDINSHTAELFI